MYTTSWTERVAEIVVSLLLLGLPLSCYNPETKANLKKMMDAPIILPEQIACIENGTISLLEDGLNEGTKLLVFIDSTECTGCRISDFYKYKPLFEMSEKNQSFQVVLLLSIPKEKYTEITELLTVLDNDFPVFVDCQNKFRTLNPTIPDNRAFHTMTLDPHGKVLLVGDPEKSKSLLRMFQRRIVK